MRTGAKKIQSLESEVVSSLQGNEIGETPGDATDFGTNYSLRLAPGTQMTGGFAVSRLVINSKGYMDIFNKSGLIRRQDLGTCGLKNVQTLEKVIPLAG
jgi:hypothetical protein